MLNSRQVYVISTEDGSISLRSEDSKIWFVGEMFTVQFFGQSMYDTIDNDRFVPNRAMRGVKRFTRLCDASDYAEELWIDTAPIEQVAMGPRWVFSLLNRGNFVKTMWCVEKDESPLKLWNRMAMAAIKEVFDE